MIILTSAYQAVVYKLWNIISLEESYPLVCSKTEAALPNIRPFLLAINSISIHLGYGVNIMWHKVVSRINEQLKSRQSGF